MVTSDHGNAEKMMAPDGSKHTAHTCNLGTFSIPGNLLKPVLWGRYILDISF